MKKTAGILLSFILVLSFCLSGCQTNRSSDNSVYQNAENWAYLETDVTGKEADVFLISPTMYSGDAENGIYNMSLNDEDEKERLLGALNMERGIYDDNARMFAPYYRQAGMSVYSMTIEDREPYLKFAFQDIQDAFYYYLDHYNDGRPIVLAGFSQGADMCLRLMKSCFGDEKLREQLVACYAIGWRITEEETEEYPQLKFASGESDTGVIISFNSESEDVEDSLMIPKGTKTLAINPLNWKTDGTAASKELNAGACFTDYDGNIKEEIPRLTGCYIDDERGALKITDVDVKDYPAAIDIFEEGVYHVYDYQFFYRNLEENVQTRIDAYLEK